MATVADSPLLSMHSISKRFGATRALADVSLTVRGGEVLALIGENGAGKSTLMKVLSGVYPPDAGTMQFGGRPFAPRGPHDARQAGVAMIYQELNLAPDLSVEDNIMLGLEERRGPLLDRRRQQAKVRAALELLGHGELPLSAVVGNLSPAKQQLVEIARALAHQAQVIVFDEPTSSLTQHDAARLFEVIRTLKARGLGIVYISHFFEELRQIGDRYTVLRDGAVVGEGRLAKTTPQEVVSLMVGRSVDELFPQVPHTIGPPLVSLQGLTGLKAPRDATFELRSGEILGIAGLVGAGRTELLRAIYALDPIRSGRLTVREIAPAATPRARIAAGMGLVSEDRKGEGLAQGRSIADNLTLSALDGYTKRGVLNLRRRASAVRDWMTRLQVKARGGEQAVAELSGGNQQKVALARVMHQQADILLLDEPTRGIDVGTKAEIYRLIGGLAAEGRAVLFVSSYLPELLAVCDRIGVMSRGRLRQIRSTADWTEELVMAAAISTDDAADKSLSEVPA